MLLSIYRFGFDWLGSCTIWQDLMMITMMMKHARMIKTVANCGCSNQYSNSSSSLSGVWLCSMFQVLLSQHHLQHHHLCQHQCHHPSLLTTALQMLSVLQLVIKVSYCSVVLWHDSTIIIIKGSVISPLVSGSNGVPVSASASKLVTGDLDSSLANLASNLSFGPGNNR